MGGSIRKFEDILGWQEARKLTQTVYQLSDEGAFAKDFALRDQLRRAAVSSMANIAEGFDCDSKREFIRFLGYARRSLAEVQSLLYIALDAKYITPPQFQALYQQAHKAKALISGFKAALERQLRET